MVTLFIFEQAGEKGEMKLRNVVRRWATNGLINTRRDGPSRFMVTSMQPYSSATNISGLLVVSWPRASTVCRWFLM